MTYAIGIPTINRYDLLKDSLKSYLEQYNCQIFIVDNGNQGIDNDFAEYIQSGRLHLHIPEKNMGVAASWNYLCKKIFEKNLWSLILNDDIFLGYSEETILNAIKRSQVGIVQSMHSWSVLLISKDLYDKIGDFDEGFYPAYFEDSDYIYRVKLQGLLHEVDPTLSPQTFRQSMTFEKDPEISGEHFADNRQRYLDKWGGCPLLETYSVPFNEKN